MATKMPKKKSKAPPTKKKPKTYNVDGLVNISVEVIAVHDPAITIGNLAGDVRRWLIELEKVCEKYGDNVKLGQLKGDLLDDERSRLREEEDGDE